MTVLNYSIVSINKLTISSKLIMQSDTQLFQPFASWSNCVPDCVITQTRAKP